MLTPDAALAKRKRPDAQQAQPQIGELPSAGDKTEAAATSTPPAVSSEASTAETQAAPDQWSSAEVEAALKECVSLLASIKVTVEPVPAMRAGQCGAAAPVLLRAVGTTTSVEISPPAIVNCRVVARLHDWVEETLQPAATAVLKSPVTRLTTASGYVCRNRIGSSTSRLSEHATANAIDLSAITTADGRRIDVSAGWGAIARIAQTQAWIQTAEAPAPSTPQASGKRVASPKPSPPSGLGGPRGDAGGGATDKSKVIGGAAPIALPAQATPETAEQRFLHGLHAGACGTFTTVLGPEANDAHKGHLHFDLATRRGKAYCQ